MEVAATDISRSTSPRQEAGRLKLTDKVMDYFPEYRDCAAPGSGDIALRDLLHMASGKTEFWFGALDGEMNSKDWAELFFRVPVSQKPGTYFLYSNACTYMLGRVIEKVSGRNVRNFLLPRLFTPIGIENPQEHRASAGIAIVRAPIGPKNSRLTTVSPQEGHAVLRYSVPGELKR